MFARILMKFTPLRLALLLGVCLAALRFAGFLPLQVLDARAVDYRLLYRGIEAASRDVVIVAVDDASIDEVGRWPWPRPTMARLVRVLESSGAAVVGFDVVQSEATATTCSESLGERPADFDVQSWENARAVLERLPDEDAVLEAALSAGDRCVLGYFYDFNADRRVEEGLLHPRRLGRFDGVVGTANGRGEARVPAAHRAIRNLPRFENAARATGYFNVVPDPGDGYYRSVPMVIRNGEDFTVPLSLAMLRLYFAEPLAVKFADFGVESVRVGAHEVPVSEDGQMLLNYRGPGKSFRHIAAADLLHSRVDPTILRDKLVLVGVTASAVADVRTTAFDPVLPGVEMHATAIDNVLRQDFLMRPSWVVLIEVAQILVAALVLGIVMRFARGIRGAGVAVLLVLNYLVASQAFFDYSGIPLGLFFPIGSICAIYVGVSVYHFVYETAEKIRIRDAFGVYVNPALAHQLSRDPSAVALGGERRELTVMFSDIRSFTSISEGLDPESLVEILNMYLGEMTDVIFDNDGTLDKYIGDAIMAVWGAPLAQEDHAHRACVAALGMRQRLESLGPQFDENGWPRLEMGVGVHTGDMVAGNMGSARRLSYTVMGDNVNLGSRLEGLTKYYRVGIIVSEDTLASVAGAFCVRELDLVRVKGRETPVRIFELMGAAAELDERSDLVERFNAALECYRSRDFAKAERILGGLLADYPEDGPSKLYLERLGVLRGEPLAPDWDPVTSMDAK